MLCSTLLLVAVARNSAALCMRAFLTKGFVGKEVLNTVNVCEWKTVL